MAIQTHGLEEDRLKEMNFVACPDHLHSRLARSLHLVSHGDEDGKLKAVRTIIRIPYAEGSPPYLKTVCIGRGHRVGLLSAKCDGALKISLRYRALKRLPKGVKSHCDDAISLGDIYGIV